MFDSAIREKTPPAWGGCCFLSGNMISYLRRYQFTVGGWPLHLEGTSCPLHREGVMRMLTYSELFQFCLVIIGIIGLFLQAKKK